MMSSALYSITHNLMYVIGFRFIVVNGPDCGLYYAAENVIDDMMWRILGFQESPATLHLTRFTLVACAVAMRHVS